MDLLRVTDTAAYMRLSEYQRKLYQAGLPRQVMGKQIRDLTFRQLTKGAGLQAHILTASSQKRTLLDLCAGVVGGGKDISGKLLIYSDINDDAAMECAGALFETLFHDYGGIVLDAAELYGTFNGEERQHVRAHRLYLIHGINDQMQPRDAVALRSFMYRRDGSLFILVGSAAYEGLRNLMEVTLRMSSLPVFALDTVETFVKLGTKEHQ